MTVTLVVVSHPGLAVLAGRSRVITGVAGLTELSGGAGLRVAIGLRTGDALGVAVGLRIGDVLGVAIGLRVAVRTGATAHVVPASISWHPLKTRSLHAYRAIVAVDCPPQITPPIGAMS